MADFDAIIVGGGPAGSTAAHGLARSGAKVIVLEAATFPRQKLCAGWVTATAWQSLGIREEAYPGTLQPFSSATLTVNGRIHASHWDHTVSYGIIRSEFDHYLVRRAAAAGAIVRDGTTIGTPQKTGTAWTVQTKKETLHAPLLIGAGGHRCPVARALAEISPEEAIVLARESETHITNETLRGITAHPGTPELFLEEDLNGYGWSFTKGNFLNIGIGCVSNGRDLNQRCANMLKRLRAEGRLPADLPRSSFQGHAYAVRLRRPRRTSGPGWMILGDAAGLARPFSGEGIGPAIESGRFAAAAVEQDDLAYYSRALEETFGSGQPSPLAQIASALPRGILNAIGRRIATNSTLRRKLIFENSFGMT